MNSGDPTPTAAAAPTAAAGGSARRSAAPAQVAFVLHSYDWSESSLIVELFARDAGRVAAVAKGAKRPTSQLRAVLMPFQLVLVQFVRGKGDAAAEVRTLRSAEWGGGDVVSLRGAGWFAGFYLNELLLRLLARDDPHSRLFDAYAQTLHGLGDSELRSEAALRGFELLLLRETGVLPQFDRTTLTQLPVAAGGRYTLRVEQGLVDAAPGEPALSGAACLELAAALDDRAEQAADAAALPRLHAVCARELQALKLLLRAQLHYHLGGAPLRTRQAVIDSQRLLEAASAPTR
ncbi:MAG TPA: DNA repair protein RecO [Burkholderiaceae bacterium]|nr:DNA repair protein RecO [Burkholderiaceae bacterium]